MRLIFINDTRTTLNQQQQDIEGLGGERLRDPLSKEQPLRGIKLKQRLRRGNVS